MSQDRVRTRTTSRVIKTSGSAISSTSRIRPALTLNTKATLTDPAWIQAAPSSPSIVTGTAPRGAVESGGHAGRAVVHRNCAYLLCDQVCTHDGIGSKERQKSTEIPAAGCCKERVNDATAIDTLGLRRDRL